jgi:uncharacterized membrane protein
MKTNSIVLIQNAFAQMNNRWTFVMGLTLTVFILAAIANLIPFAGGFLTSPFFLGYLYVLNKFLADQDVHWKEFFRYFLNFEKFIQIVLLGAIHSIGLVIGFLFLVVPGIWFLVASSFAYYIYFEKEVDAVTCIKQSIEMVRGHWWRVCRFCVALFFLNVLGALALGFGLLFTVPVSVISCWNLYQELSQSTKSDLVVSAT